VGIETILFMIMDLFMIFLTLSSRHPVALYSLFLKVCVGNNNMAAKRQQQKIINNHFFSDNINNNNNEKNEKKK
jgi:hypothetical protein